MRAWPIAAIRERPLLLGMNAPEPARIARLAIERIAALFDRNCQRLTLGGDHNDNALVRFSRTGILRHEYLPRPRALGVTGFQCHGLFSALFQDESPCQHVIAFSSGVIVFLPDDARADVCAPDAYFVPVNAFQVLCDENLPSLRRLLGAQGLRANYAQHRTGNHS